MRPERYSNAVFDDGERDTTVRPRGKQPSKSKFHPIGYKRTATKTPPRMQSSDLLSESSGYQDESDDDGDDKGPKVIDISKKKNKMPSNIQRGRSGDKRSKVDDNHNEPSRSKRRRMEEGSNEDYKSDVRKRMFVDEGSTRRIVVNENEYNDEEEQEDEDSDDGKMLLSYDRTKDQLIATLTRKIKDLEKIVHEMSSVKRNDNRDKSEWTREEINFVKDINDFGKEELYSSLGRTGSCICPMIVIACAGWL